MLSIDLQFMPDKEKLYGAKAAWHHGRYGDRWVCAKQVAECFAFLVLLVHKSYRFMNEK